MSQHFHQLLYLFVLRYALTQTLDTSDSAVIGPYRRDAKYLTWI